MFVRSILSYIGLYILILSVCLVIEQIILYYKNKYKDK